MTLSESVSVLCQPTSVAECFRQSASIADLHAIYLSLTLSEGACMLSVSQHLSLTLSEGATACSLSVSIYR
jgi:hypothetical protein